jgi:CHAT domain-containing protein
VLENGAELETRHFKLYKNTIRSRIAQSASYKAYWQPVELHLSDVKKINVSLDGIYNQININTLQDETGLYLISRYDITLVGNVRELVQPSNSTQASANATLIGFPSYGPAFSALPGTKVELESIGQILKSRGFSISTLIQKDASETRIKSVRSPAVLHIASHGYFLPNEETSGSFGQSSDNILKNPLLRSGLIFAEASGESAIRDDLSGADNGFLTAYEVINLSLDETGLVILSACETALGDIKSGEGVYGLQRAFLIAGSRFIVMSLWKVDDSATQELMINFYKNWKSVGNVSAAFKTAQLELKEKYKDPYYWGAFILVGNSN